MAAPSLLALVLAYGFIVWNANKGFDITDESFYLLNIFYPNRNIGAVSEFGQYLGLFSDFYPHNVPFLRIFGVAFILCVSVYYSIFASRYLSSQFLIRTLLIIAFAISTLSIFRFWLITPSYNTFVLAGAMIVAASVIRSINRAGLLGEEIRIADALAIGGVLVAIGRPTSAIAVGGVAGLWIACVCPYRQTLRIGVAAVCVFILLFLLHAAFLGGGVEPFLTRVNFAKDLAATLDAGHTFGDAIGRVLTALRDVPGQMFSTPSLAGALVTLIVFFIGWPPRLHLNEKRMAQSCVAGVAALVAVTAYSTHVVQAVSSWGNLGVRLVLLLLGQFLFFKLAARLNGETFPKSNPEVANSSPVITALALASIALVAPFGGTGVMIGNSGTAFPLYVGSALFLAMAIIPPARWLLRVSVIYLLAFLPVLFLFYVSMMPYRLPESMSHQTNPITLAGSDSPILVDGATANWVNALRSGALEHGWSEGTPLIDMTGATPGAALVLGANAPVTPWIVGGYKGSKSFAASVLAAAGSEILKDAWILTAPTGAAKNDEAVLSEAGLDFPSGYEIAAEVTTGYRKEKQLLWKPVRKND
ncbi:hypothetical protein [Mesorhizobium denitrificans]|uniref:hypothetical protein n=1 Tax=Mesorhizobium denitrificans TaxID=2294114 RepID=UPI0011C0371C|nr:hypothetical protein [Mesorhizobium denitrificans]